MMNPIVPAIKKFVYDLLGPERYTESHDDTLESVARNFNEKEYQKFGKLIAEIFEAGYMRSVLEHQAELKRLGLKHNMKYGSSTPQPTNPIFKKNPPDSQ